VKEAVAGSEPMNARGKRDILRVVFFGVRSTRFVVLTGSLESVRYDCMKCFTLLYSDEKRERPTSVLSWVYIDQRLIASTFWKYLAIVDVYDDYAITTVQRTYGAFLETS